MTLTPLPYKNKQQNQYMYMIYILFIDNYTIQMIDSMPIKSFAQCTCINITTVKANKTTQEMRMKYKISCASETYSNTRTQLHTLKFMQQLWLKDMFKETEKYLSSTHKYVCKCPKNNSTYVIYFNFGINTVIQVWCIVLEIWGAYRNTGVIPMKIIFLKKKKSIKKKYGYIFVVFFPLRNGGGDGRLYYKLPRCFHDLHVYCFLQFGHREP